MTHARSFTLEPLGPFSFSEAARFWGGFTPAGHAGLDEAGHLHMAFAVEGRWDTVGICVRELDGHDLRVDGYGEVDLEVVRRQTARILSLNVDGRGWPAIGVRDTVVGRLQGCHAGLRPVCFYSTYEAAVWAILSQRVQMQQAARVKARLCEAAGELVEIHGEPMRAFPAPGKLLELESIPGSFGSKLASLRAVAMAAMAGELDADGLLPLPEEEAFGRLRHLPGIGPFSAELILMRGAGHPDYLTLLEPRFRHAVALAYELAELPTDDELRRISDAWRPYRTWATFLLRQSGTR